MAYYDNAPSHKPQGKKSFGREKWVEEGSEYRGARHGGRPSGKRDDNRAYGEKKSFGDRKPYGEKKSFGDRKPYGEKKSYGDRKPYERRDRYDRRKCVCEVVYSAADYRGEHRKNYGAEHKQRRIGQQGEIKFRKCLDMENIEQIDRHTIDCFKNKQSI